MRRQHPYAILILFALAALLVLGAGIHLAKRTETVRDPAGRKAFTDLAGAMASELARLEALYESHLAGVTERIVDQEGTQNSLVIRDACETVVGVDQFALLHSSGPARKDYHLDFVRPAIPLAVPTFHEDAPAPPGRESLVIAAEMVFPPFAAGTGWVMPTEELIFFRRHLSQDEVILLRIDRARAVAAMNEGLADELEAGGASLRDVSTAATVLDPVGALTSTELSSGETAREKSPDLELPLGTRFGKWTLSFWDRLETNVFYHRPTLAVAAALALLLLASGGAAFHFQRRALRVAEQRVSFVNRVSHELRTPLTNILLHSDLALEECDDGPSTGAGRHVGLIREEAGRLTRMIENVLNFSKIDREETLDFTASVCEPDALVDEVLAPFEPALRRRSIEVVRDRDAPGTVSLDRDALALILSNLISNVEKYAAAGGWLRVATARRDDRLEITVADRGPGVPAEAAQRIFAPFERLRRNVKDGVTGTGLGLSIAREYSERLGGALDLMPSDRGAVFRVSLPVRPANVVPISEGREAV